ncbi:hypothetical protein AEAC466_07880 [Asticcacaulis sp. AC466]|uniref:hypothetical protein n=1 Tax=Asticcacaulis sp. AC466 TaxID=1282362 RepID=UPI0003C3DCDC|nr:hypothetical protein [Asticcacaulis sp. AC466]ESQ84270.1 hypothetical protein AEAC466_07880 [Asticcacaulis sp. AC466]
MNSERAVEQMLEGWQQSLYKKLDVGGLFTRNKIVHKWKAPWRSLLLREASYWRIHDLLSQSYILHQGKQALGARILLRSAFETLAVLIYLNQITAAVLDGSLDFHLFSDKTSTLLLGSRNADTNIKAINIVTVLEKANKQYPGLYDLYADLSESAHPNYEGMLLGYSTADRENYVTTFSNKWSDIYGARHADLMMSCMDLYNTEYDNIWPARFENLESWIEAHDAQLEDTKPPAKET